MLPAIFAMIIGGMGMLMNWIWNRQSYWFGMLFMLGFMGAVLAFIQGFHQQGDVMMASVFVAFLLGVFTATENEYGEDPNMPWSSGGPSETHSEKKGQSSRGAVDQTNKRGRNISGEEKSERYAKVSQEDPTANRKHFDSQDLPEDLKRKFREAVKEKANELRRKDGQEELRPGNSQAEIRKTIEDNIKQWF